jgi:hypothetical protein
MPDQSFSVAEPEQEPQSDGVLQQYITMPRPLKFHVRKQIINNSDRVTGQQ